MKSRSLMQTAAQNFIHVGIISPTRFFLNATFTLPSSARN